MWIGWKAAEILLIEQGGEDGQLPSIFSPGARDHAPDFFCGHSLSSHQEDARLQSRQAEALKRAQLAEKWKWSETCRRKTAGYIFCNELVDAFPSGS